VRRGKGQQGGTEFIKETEVRIGMEVRRWTEGEKNEVHRRRN